MLWQRSNFAWYYPIVQILGRTAQKPMLKQSPPLHRCFLLKRERRKDAPQKRKEWEGRPRTDTRNARKWGVSWT